MPRGSWALRPQPAPPRQKVTACVCLVSLSLDLRLCPNGPWGVRVAENTVAPEATPCGKHGAASRSVFVSFELGGVPVPLCCPISAACLSCGCRHRSPPARGWKGCGGQEPGTGLAGLKPRRSLRGFRDTQLLCFLSFWRLPSALGPRPRAPVPAPASTVPSCFPPRILCRVRILKLVTPAESLFPRK